MEATEAGTLREADRADLGTLAGGVDPWDVALTDPAIDVAVVDFETTGLDGDAWPVEVAAVGIGLDGTERWAFHTLCRPPVSVPAEVAAIHGIDDVRLSATEVPTVGDALDRLEAATDGKLLASYNWPFDRRIWARAAERTGRAAPPLRALDPLVWAKELDKYQRGKKLRDVCLRRGIPVPGHRAEEDARATARLLPRLLGELTRAGRLDGVRTAADLWRWQLTTAVRQDNGYAGWCERNGNPKPELTWKEGAWTEPG